MKIQINYIKKGGSIIKKGFENIEQKIKKKTDNFTLSEFVKSNKNLEKFLKNGDINDKESNFNLSYFNIEKKIKSTNLISSVEFKEIQDEYKRIVKLVIFLHLILLQKDESINSNNYEENSNMIDIKELLEISKKELNDENVKNFQDIFDKIRKKFLQTTNNAKIKELLEISTFQYIQTYIKPITNKSLELIDKWKQNFDNVEWKKWFRNIIIFKLSKHIASNIDKITGLNNIKDKKILTSLFATYATLFVDAILNDEFGTAIINLFNGKGTWKNVFNIFMKNLSLDNILENFDMPKVLTAFSGSMSGMSDLTSIMQNGGSDKSSSSFSVILKKIPESIFNFFKEKFDNNFGNLTQFPYLNLINENKTYASYIFLMIGLIYLFGGRIGDFFKRKVPWENKNLNIKQIEIISNKESIFSRNEKNKRYIYFKKL